MTDESLEYISEATAYHQAGHAVIAADYPGQIPFDTRKGCAQSVPPSALIESRGIAGGVVDKPTTEYSPEMRHWLDLAAQTSRELEEKARQEKADMWLRFIVAGPVAEAILSDSDPLTTLAADELHVRTAWKIIELVEGPGQPTLDRRDQTMKAVATLLRERWSEVGEAVTRMGAA